MCIAHRITHTMALLTDSVANAVLTWSPSSFSLRFTSSLLLAYRCFSSCFYFIFTNVLCADAWECSAHTQHCTHTAVHTHSFPGKSKPHPSFLDYRTWDHGTVMSLLCHLKRRGNRVAPVKSTCCSGRGGDLHSVPSILVVAPSNYSSR